VCACILWATDTWNSIPTAVTGLGAVLVLYAPYIGAIDFHKVPALPFSFNPPDTRFQLTPKYQNTTRLTASIQVLT